MKKKKAPVYPTNRTINLCIKEASPFAAKKLIPLLLALLVLAVLFAKFAVADRYEAMYEAQAETAELRSQRSALAAASSDYNEVLARYQRYSTSWMTDEEALTVKRTDMLDLMEKEFMPYCQVLSAEAVGNVLSVQLGGITLDDTSRFVSTLYGRSDVMNVAVYTASTEAEGGAGAIVSMVITMYQPIEGGEEP